MKILILEDEEVKMDLIKTTILEIDKSIEISTSVTFQTFQKQVERDDFHLIIVDLLVPQFDKESTPTDLTDQIIDATRDHTCRNFRTPVVAITRFDQAAEENFKDLNCKDIFVVTFSVEKNDWKDMLKEKILACMPPLTYDFVIICALQKEVKGFEDAGYAVGTTCVINGLDCREIEIEEKSGVIVTSPRMGLVSCAITSSIAIELFSPQLVCMSGICAGIENKAEIYDIVIPEICHQHDFGKWGADGFEPEPYSVQINNDVRLRINEILQSPDFNSTIEQDIKILKSEIPENKESLEFRVFMAPASSGSAVIADINMASVVRKQHRKNTAFEMESFAVYEAARLSRTQPKFFSAKAVVDDGGIHKGDKYHRVACILSAKAVYELIRRNVEISS